ncbi:MAG TPA: hypothetical protein VH251_06390 [Verrucomicrobiae bacterium]|nr:hypothetical protein [Verrucomicrobiae bacterium]
MILSLRRRHRRVFIALGIFVPVVFAIGIAARKPVPMVDELPAALTAVPLSYEMVGPEHSDLFAKTPLQAQVLRDQESGRFAIEFIAGKNFLKPDLIVYWVAGNPAVTSSVPDAAVLLGAFGSSALPLPDQATKSNGVLILYSLANGEIVDVSKPISLSASNTSPH